MAEFITSTTDVEPATRKSDPKRATFINQGLINVLISVKSNLPAKVIGCLQVSVLHSPESKLSVTPNSFYKYSMNFY